jgi:hypothetical protein
MSESQKRAGTQLKVQPEGGGGGHDAEDGQIEVDRHKGVWRQGAMITRARARGMQGGRGEHESEGGGRGGQARRCRQEGVGRECESEGRQRRPPHYHAPPPPRGPAPCPP